MNRYILFKKVWKKANSHETTWRSKIVSIAKAFMNINKKVFESTRSENFMVKRVLQVLKSLLDRWNLVSPRSYSDKAVVVVCIDIPWRSLYVYDRYLPFCREQKLFSIPTGAFVSETWNLQANLLFHNVKMSLCTGVAHETAHT